MSDQESYTATRTVLSHVQGKAIAETCPGVMVLKQGTHLESSKHRSPGPTLRAAESVLLQNLSVCFSHEFSDATEVAGGGPHSENHCPRES